MAQFAVYRNDNAATREAVPFLLDVQSDVLDSLITRVVVPLVDTGVAGRAAVRLNPVFRIEGIDVMMSTQELASIPLRSIGERVDTIANRRTDIVAALDLLFTGV